MLSRNTLAVAPSKFQLVNSPDPNLIRDVFSYDKVPHIPFDFTDVTISPAEEIWITDTTFRDGQQARPPYTTEQIVTLFDFLHRLGGEQGVIRQSEFFVYSERDRKAVDLCRERGYRFPEVTGWIRAKKEDFELVRSMGLKETGILTSCSDYHIYRKLGLDRKKALDRYLRIVREAIEAGVRPRCHLEDLTRAGFYGFVLPFAQALMDITEESGVPIKMRMCDTLGFGVPFASAALPRSVPKIIHALTVEAGYPGSLLEWHGHNDFYMGHVNGVTAWLYGCAAVNTTLLGFGERTGNSPLEAAIIAYISLTGDDSLDTPVITEIAGYFEREIGQKIPANQPFVGASFNVTSAGIHVDGVAKDEEIYNIFDTKKILDRPIGITINDKSGSAGVAMWTNIHMGLHGEARISKKHPHAVHMYAEIKRQYDAGRVTSMSDSEMLSLAHRYFPELFASDLDRTKARARELAEHLIERYADLPEFQHMDAEGMEKILQQLADEHAYVQFCYVTDLQGRKVTRNITQLEEAPKYKALSEGVFDDRDWFLEPLRTGKVHVTGFYTSNITHRLCITVSDVIENEKDEVVGIVGIDLAFEDLVRAEE